MSSPRSIKEMLVRDEGIVSHAYQDHLGFWTIGVGRLIDERRGGGLSYEEVMYLLDNDITEKAREVGIALPWVADIDHARYAVIIGMAFQLGIRGLLKFKKALNAARDRDWAGAAREMLDSNWAKQTPERAQRMAEQMRTGKWQ